MSGPWDRPSPDPDAEWSTEDLGAPGSAQPANPERDPWSSGDLWPQPSRQASQAWDDWPSTAPPDDLALDAPEPALSDPWAESWSDDSGSPSAASEPARTLDSAAAWTPEPAASTPRWEPEPAERVTPSWRPDPESAWSPSGDGITDAAAPDVVSLEAPEPEPIEPEPEPIEPAAAGPAAIESEPDQSDVVDERRDESRSTPWWRPNPSPRVLPWMPDTDPWASATPSNDAQAADATAEPAATNAAAPVVEEAPASRPALDWLPEPEPEREPEPEPEAQPEPEPEPKPEPEPEPEPEAEDEPDPEPEAEVAAERPAFDMSWTPSRWGDAEPPVISPWNAGAGISSPPPEMDAPEVDAAERDAGDDLAPVAPVSEPEARSGWRTEDDAPSVESTQVLPTTWEPPPAPAEPIRAATNLEPVAGEPRTRLLEPTNELDDELEARPSTAEQAVPWLIGFILLLAGMVIVLLALIFAGEESFGAGASPSPSNAAVVVVTGSPEPSATPTPATPSATEAATPEPTATPIPLPEYGPLEMVYQGRAAALAPIYLLRHDFTVEEQPTTMAQDPALDVRRFAWAPDGTLGAGLLADVLVSIEPGVEKRRLGDGIMTITFGRDGSTVYAVRVTQDGDDDVANVLAIDFASGDTTELAAISYPRPSIEAEPALEEAQFADDGGAVRLYWMEDETLRLWALGAGNWTIDPGDGAVEELDEDDVPTLWSPREEQRVTLETSDGITTLTLVDEAGDTLASTTIEGRVSHLRWSPDGKRVAFTVGRSASGGGVVQNLFLWDPKEEGAPTQLTNTGAAFGAEWLGSIQRWRP